MARYVALEQMIARGIEFLSVRDTDKPDDFTHVVRVQTTIAQPIIGSLLGGRYDGSHCTGSNNDDTQVQKENFLSIVRTQAARGNLNLQLNHNHYTPASISNGVFYENDSGDAPVFLCGTIVNLSNPLATPLAFHDTSKWNRWIFLQKLNADGSMIFDFRHQHAAYSAPTIASDGWFNAIGGGGGLIANGLPVAIGTREWFTTYNGSFSHSQTYCSGPVIARNNSAGSPVIYVLQDFTNGNHDILDVRRIGRTWIQMANYLSGPFLSEINRTYDGIVNDAIVYDGGSSRQFWIRGIGPLQEFTPTTPGYNNDYAIPHHICVWAKT